MAAFSPQGSLPPMGPVRPWLRRRRTDDFLHRNWLPSPNAPRPRGPALMHGRTSAEVASEGCMRESVEHPRVRSENTSLVAHG